MAETTQEPLIFEVGDVVATYIITEKIDEGGFGQVFRVSKNNERYAMKIEPSGQEGGAAIKLEAEVMSVLRRHLYAVNDASGRARRDDKKPYYFPRCVSVGKREKYHYLVMDLLGDNLKVSRFKSSNAEKLNPGTWARIGIQCLHIVKQFHDVGFVHRDLKPANFAFGDSTIPLKSRQIHLLDFGLARRFVLKKSSKRGTKNVAISKEPMTAETNPEVINKEAYKFRPPRRHCDFRGTTYYASPNAHDLKDLGRHDDLWSLLIMLAEMTKQLPWATEPDSENVKTMKKNMKLTDLFGDDRWKGVDESLRKCNYYSVPCYDLIYAVLNDMVKESGAKWDDPYDWETPQHPTYVAWKAEMEKNKVQKADWDDLEMLKMVRFEDKEKATMNEMEEFTKLERTKNEVKEEPKKEEVKKEEKKEEAKKVEPKKEEPKKEEKKEEPKKEEPKKEDGKHKEERITNALTTEPATTMTPTTAPSVMQKKVATKSMMVGSKRMPLKDASKMVKHPTDASKMAKNSTDARHKHKGSSINKTRTLDSVEEGADDKGKKNKNSNENKKKRGSKGTKKK